MVKNVRVYLEEERSEYCQRFRCGCIVAENEHGEEMHYPDLIDSWGYATIRALQDEIAGFFQIRQDAVWIAG